MKNLLCLCVLLLMGVAVNAQKVSLKGSISDYKYTKLKGVEIYIDTKRIKKTTNSKGKYSFKYPNKFKLITVYTPKHGFINWQYNGEKRIDFVFPRESEPMKKADFIALGYSNPAPAKEHEVDYYANYSSILKILDHRFPQVSVKGEQVFISRRGINAVLLDDPLILVNGIPTTVSTIETIPTNEVKSIRVISNGSEAAVFGYRGMNGVIIIRLKSAEDES